MKNRDRFLEWIKIVEQLEPSTLNLHAIQYLRQHNPTHPTPIDLKDQFFNLLNTPSNAHKTTTYTIGGEMPVNWICQEPLEEPIYEVICEDTAHPTFIKNARVGQLHFRACQHTIQLENVFAAKLTFAFCRDVKIINCCIGDLIILSPAVASFSFQGGCLLNIICSSPTDDSPFSGSVYFDQKSIFPRAPDKYLLGPQPYRNMRAHMLKLENTPMVSLFHTLEQSVERRIESNLFNKSLSYAYEFISDYGSSPGRPVVLWLALSFITFIITITTSGALTNLDALGWQLSLVGDECSARLARALTLTMQSAFNPLGIFGTRGFVYAASGGLELWLAIHGVLSTLFIALFFFAVRRRFKMT